MHFYVREVAAIHPFHNIPYQNETDATARKDELNKAESRKEDVTVYEVVSSLTLSIEEDRREKYRQFDDE
jgi:hypothetical protein